MYLLCNNVNSLSHFVTFVTLVIIIIRGNKSKLNYVEQNKISSRLNKQHHDHDQLILHINETHHKTGQC